MRSNMVTSFDEYLLERALSSLNESVVRFSDRFADLLGMIDSPIADALLKSRGQDMPVKTNYFDLSKDPDHMSFLVDAKAEQMSQRGNVVEVVVDSPVYSYYYNPLFDQIGFDRSKMRMPQPGEIAWVVGETEWHGKQWVHLAFDEALGKDGPGCVIQKTMVAPSDLEHWRKNRQEIRVGRGVRALASSLGLAVTDGQVEDFVNKFRANWERANDAFRNFALVRGNKIAELYHRDNYLLPNAGDLGNSCMSNKPAWYFGIYTQNPMVCSLLVLRAPADPSKIVGRALVWKLTKPDITYMDRVYANKPAQAQLFKEYAKSQGWHCKAANNNTFTGEAIDPSGANVDLRQMVVRIKTLDYTAYPYMDTLCFLISKDGETKLASAATGGQMEDGYSSAKNLRSTDGIWVDEEECETCSGTGRAGCEQCDATGLVDCTECHGAGLVDGERCGECDGARRFECEDCDGDGYVDCNECG